MFRFAAPVGAVFSALAGGAWADVADTVLDVSQSYNACFRMQDDGAGRLACYDGLTSKVNDLMDITAESIGSGCTIEAWNFAPKAGHTLLKGATTCAAGRLDYRLYDGEKFLTSGFTYFKGYAFQSYADVANPPDQISIKYTIEVE